MKYNQYLLPGLLLAMCSCGQPLQDRKAVADSQSQKILETTQVTEGTMYNDLVLNGDVVCDESKLGKVFVPCSGKVQGIKVETGTKVIRGQLLATVFSSDAAEYGKQLSEAEASIRVAQRNLAMKTDMQKSGMATDKDVAEALEQVIVAKAEQQRLQQIARVNGYSGKSHAALLAPLSGYVISKNVYSDSYIDGTNNDTPAFEIADLSSVWVLADVYEDDISKIHQGDEVTITVMAYPDMVMYGHIDKVYMLLDNNSKTMKIRIQLQNSRGLLKPGMFASVYVGLKTNGKKMLQVPTSAIIFENGNNYVVVADRRNHYHRQKIQIAHQSDTVTFLESGVNVGDRVVSRNALLEYEALR